MPLCKPPATRTQILSGFPLEIWPQVDKSIFVDSSDKASIKRHEHYCCRESSVVAYLNNEPWREIEKNFGLSRQFVNRLIHKCLATHPDGKIWGFRALLPFIRQKRYDRLAKIKSGQQHGGQAGALTQLFETYPDIQESIEALFLKKVDKVITVHEAVISFKSIHKRFIDACRASGIKATDYPFTSKWLGYHGLVNYLKQLALIRYGEAVAARFGKVAARNLNLGLSAQPLMPATRPYFRVEFDGHKVDVSFIIKIPTPYGQCEERVVNRLWILVIRETLSGAILSYHVTYGLEYNQHEVAQCIKKAIQPWVPRKITTSGLSYPVHGGMPSHIIKELEWATFQELLYDNAKANLANTNTRILTEVVGAAANAGPVDSPERRAFIERFFGLFEENGFHRLPSTLGNSPQDIRRTKPEKMAEKYKIRLEHIEDLVEILIAEFNGRPSHGNGYRSPLERLQYFVSQPGVIIPKLDESKRRRLHMFDYRICRTIRGNMKEGKRPYVEILGVRYTSEILSQQPELIGKKLVIYVDPQDGRFAHAYFADRGEELGLLDAKGFWGRTPHTLEMRKAILEGKIRQFEHELDKEDPIHSYLDQQAKDALTEKKARKKFLKNTRGSHLEVVAPTFSPDHSRKRESKLKRDVSAEMFSQKVFRV
ncbi:MAG: hypothetical protein HOP24_09175 [Sideroxydans sp.]|nr:hypothetical protein [Sideroxydans sp.]